MKALRAKDGRAELHEIPIPDRNGESLVRVLKSGICNTDLEIVRGYAGFHGTIGHEFVGIVEHSPNRPELIGKRVVGEINAGCGNCVLCMSGDSRHCPERTVLGIVGRDGAHAELLQLPGRNLIEVPGHVPDEEAVFAEPLAAAFGITEQVDFTNKKVAVIGDGKLGLLCAASLSAAAGSLILIGKHSQKISVAARLNVEGVLLANAAKLNRDFDIVIEASGSESGFETAISLVRPRGKIVLKSTFHGKSYWDTSRIVVDEISIVGSRCGQMSDAIRLLDKRSVDVTQLINYELPLTEGVQAINLAAEKGVLKVLLSMTA